LTELHVAVTLSHLKAVQQACVTRAKSGSRLALVLEDDADFGALEHWPASLAQMAMELPPSWAVVNAAPSNNIGGAYSAEALQEQRVFRDARMNVTRYKFNMDYAAVAVLYNLANPSVCQLASSVEPAVLMQQAIQPCEVADMMIYRLFGGESFENMYTARVPLLYFGKLGPELEQSTAGNDNFDKHRWALAQRSAWATFSRMRPAVCAATLALAPLHGGAGRPPPLCEGWACCRLPTCTDFDSPFE